jgi:hypothetical protein
LTRNVRRLDSNRWAFGAELRTIVLTAAAAIIGACTAPNDREIAGARIRTSLSFEDRLRIVPSDSAERDFFGDSVAFVGSWILVGASDKKTEFGTEGVVYAFAREGNGWAERERFQPFDAHAGDGLFGHVIAANADTLAISNSYRQTGSQEVDLFGQTGDGWTHLAELTEPGPPAGTTFGYSLSMSGSTLLVSNTLGSDQTGAVYVFVREGSAWREQATLVDPDVAKFGIFGSPCFSYGDDAFVGVTEAEVSSVDYFARQGSTWSKLEALVPEVRRPNDSFGFRMAGSADDLFISAPDNDELATGAGAVYVFHRDGASWTQTQVLLPWNDPIEGNKPHAGTFGYSVAADGDLLLVGALREDTAYVFQRDTSGVWQPASKLFNRQATGGGFGGAVALQGRTAIVAAPLEGNTSAHTIQNGAVYVFDLEQDVDEPCSTDSDCVTGSCVDGSCAEPNGVAGSSGFAGQPGTAGTGDVSSGGSAGSAPKRPALESNGCACRIDSAGSDASGVRGARMLVAGLAVGLCLRRGRGAQHRRHKNRRNIRR